MRNKYLVILTKNEDGTDYVYDSGKITSIDLYGKKVFDEILDFQTDDDVINYEKWENFIIIREMLDCIKAVGYFGELSIVWMDDDTDKALFSVLYKYNPDDTAELKYVDLSKKCLLYKEDEGLIEKAADSEDVKKCNSKIEEELKGMRQLFEELRLKLSETEGSYE